MADNQKYVQAQSFQLAGSGVSVGANSMTLSSFNGIDGTPLTMANFGTTGFGTVQPGSRDQEEQIVFTGVVQNLNGTATLTGVSSVLFVSPYTQTANFQKSHPGGATFIISNTSGFYDTFANKNDDETIVGSWTFPGTTGTGRPKNVVDADATLDTELITHGELARAVITGAVAASETVPGISMEATQADVDAKTAFRNYLGNPYRLFLDPAKMRSTKYNDYVADTGAANVYAIAPSPTNTAYSAGQQFTFKAANTNTGTSTLNVNGIGAVTIKVDSNILSAGDIQAGQIYSVVYDGTDFQLVSVPHGIVNGNYTVNADERISEWYTTQILAPFPGGAGETPWTITAGVTNTQYANGAVVTKNDAFSASASLTGITLTTVQPLVFGPTINLRLKVVVSSITPTTDISAGIGFNVGGTAVLPTDNNAAVNFIFYNGNIYTHTANDVTHTSNIIQAYTTGQTLLLEIVVNGNTNAEFYINGTLVDTITTDLPNGQTAALVIKGDENGTSATCGFPFISHLTYGQQIN